MEVFSMKNKKETKKIDHGFKVRPDEDISNLIRHNYELYRQKELVAGKKISSLNQYICRIIELGIDSMEVAV